ncbi:uncharacterized protein LOC130494991 [Raphanus sativus]|uniref:Uncharacterized protein LOC130494991 n=1 Tax=Raphanus sativus TaxID=3726 RepID=A0A9W3BRB1_RAPSA|nr:uncharacterized protein LOC130494991 [Raphanus sativus]
MQIDPSQLVSFKEALILSSTWIALPPYGFTSNIFPWICWLIWTSRNRLIFEKRASTPREIVLGAITAVKEWDLAQAKTKNCGITSPISSGFPSQQNPELPSIYCNTDAAWRADSRNAGLAWVFSDHEGQEHNRGSQFQDNVSSSCMAEALAVRSALLHAAEINITSI